MHTDDTSKQKLNRFFEKKRIAQLDDLFELLKTQSRMSVFRKLKSLGYFSSFTHAGSFYTLTDIPIFDQLGLWFHHGVGFSRAGTLKKTISELVFHSETGMTAKELHALLKLPPGNTLYNTLRDLLIASQIKLHELAIRPIYISIDPKRAEHQIAQRQRARYLAPPAELTNETVIEVLLETLHASTVRVSAAIVSSRLRVRGVTVTTAQVEQVFDQYKLQPEKKTARSHSKHSQS